jgi:hypothetical protein
MEVARRGHRVDERGDTVERRGAEYHRWRQRLRRSIGSDDVDHARSPKRGCWHNAALIDVVQRRFKLREAKRSWMFAARSGANTEREGQIVFGS